MMSGFGNPGGLLLIMAYLFIFQGILVIFGWRLKEKREKILNWNILIGLLPLKSNVEMLYSRYYSEFLLWDSWDWVFTFFCICGVLNIIFLGVPWLFRLTLAMLSSLTNPTLLNSVPVKLKLSP